MGAAYGTAKSGVGIASMGVLKPDLIMKSIIPVVGLMDLGNGRYFGNLRDDSGGDSEPEDKGGRLQCFQGLQSFGGRTLLRTQFTCTLLL